MTELLDRLARLTATWGPSGREQKVSQVLREELAGQGAIWTDRAGNLLARRAGKPGGQRVLLVAHMDTGGAMALNITDRGLIYLAPVGGLKAHHLIGQRVVWDSGVVGVLQHEHAEDANEVDFKRLFCDIGATSRDEALQNLALGDMCTLTSDLQLMDDLIIAPGLDNRAGCAVLLQVAKHLADCDHEVTFAFTVQGESAFRGAGPAAYGVDPDLAIVIDGTLSGDMPRAPRVATRLGGGPALRLKDGGFMAHHRLAALIRATAEAQAIPLQIEISNGSSEGQAVTAASGGIPTAVIGLPLRYRGTASEMASQRDLHASADLILKLLQTPLDLG